MIHKCNSQILQDIALQYCHLYLFNFFQEGKSYLEPNFFDPKLSGTITSVQALQLFPFFSEDFQSLLNYL